MTIWNTGALKVHVDVVWVVPPSWRFTSWLACASALTVAPPAACCEWRRGFISGWRVNLQYVVNNEWKVVSFKRGVVLLKKTTVFSYSVFQVTGSTVNHFYWTLRKEQGVCAIQTWKYCWLFQVGNKFSSLKKISVFEYIQLKVLTLFSTKKKTNLKVQKNM